MDRVRTNATLFAEHSARIKRTLRPRRALDTRIVLRSTMTPISPASSSRPLLAFLPLFLLRFVIGSFFFPFYECSFFSTSLFQHRQDFFLRADTFAGPQEMFIQHPYPSTLF